MGRTPFAERPGSLRILGMLFLGFVALAIFLTYAFFARIFVDYKEVTLLGERTGTNLPRFADVKLRGMIVGEVRSVAPVTEGAGVELKLAIKPEFIDTIPQDVTADFRPKTIFGEYYVNLLPPENPSGESLQEGDTITEGYVPAEVQVLIDDLYPIFTAINPAELSYALTAVAQALDGRGKQLGETLVTANNYIEKLNPDVQTLVTDLTQLGTVADGYADAMPDLGRLLKNAVVTGNTIVAKRAELAAFFDEGTGLANSLAALIKKSGADYEATVSNSREALDILSDYSSSLACAISGVRGMLPRLSSVYRAKTIHVDLEVIPNQPTSYQSDEAWIIPKYSAVEQVPEAQPNKGLKEVCANIKLLQDDDPSNDPYSQTGTIYPGPEAELFELIGVKGDHNKFGSGNRAAAANLFGSPSLSDTDSPADRELIKQFVAASTGVSPSEVPDVASLFLSPILRGAEVKY